MGTLGEKVTGTIIGAVGKGAEAAALGKNAELKELVSGVVATVLENPDLPPETRKLFEAAQSETSVTDVFLKIVTAILGFIPVMMAIGEPVAEGAKQLVYRATPTRIPNEHDLVLSYFRRQYTLQQLYDEAKRLGLREDRIYAVVQALRARLSIDDIRNLSLRGELTPDELKYRLGYYGFEDKDKDFIQKLFWQIPNTQDLIRMAVREAFTPYAIENYQLGAGFPADFGTWAAKQGLSQEWAQRYWYAHWVLPSITQGYEMFQRRVIDEKTLRDLLTYADVLPWWHDKIIKIAYRTLTRVDVRRMYQLGVLDRPGVKLAYQDLGYNEEKAEQMTLFTLKYTSQAERDLTKADILSGFGKGVLSKEESEEMLTELGYDEDEISFYLAQEDLKSAETTRELTLSYLKSLYLEGVLDKPTTTARLAEAGYEQTDIQLLYALWEKEAPAKTAHPSRADLDSFLGSGIIDEDIYIEEMWNLGYSERYIGWYLSRAIASK